MVTSCKYTEDSAEETLVLACLEPNMLVHLKIEEGLLYTNIYQALVFNQRVL